MNGTSFSTVLNAVIPVFGIMAAGFAVRKLNWLTEQADQSLLKLTINLLVPALILDSILGNAALRRAENLILPPLFAMVTVSSGILLARWLSPWAGLKTLPQRRTFALAGGLQNYGYVPLPLTVFLFDPGTTGVLFIHNMGVELVIWTLGIAVITGAGMAGGWRRVINVPLVTILVAVGLNLSGAYSHVPRAALNTVHMIGQCAIPVAVLLIGAIIADHVGEMKGPGALRVFVVGALFRLGLMPVLFLLLAKCLPASIELKRVILLEAAMPSAVFPIILSKHFGGDPPTALRVVIGTQILSLLTIPIWIRFGGQWLGLW